MSKLNSKQLQKTMILAKWCCLKTPKKAHGLLLVWHWHSTRFTTLCLEYKEEWPSWKTTLFWSKPTLSNKGLSSLKHLWGNATRSSIAKNRISLIKKQQKEWSEMLWTLRARSTKKRMQGKRNQRSNSTKSSAVVNLCMEQLSCQNQPIRFTIACSAKSDN